MNKNEITIRNSNLELKILPHLGRITQMSFKGTSLLCDSKGGASWDVISEKTSDEKRKRSFEVNRISNKRAIIECKADKLYTQTSQKIKIELFDDAVFVSKRIKNLADQPAKWANLEMIPLMIKSNESSIMAPADSWTPEVDDRHVKEIFNKQISYDSLKKVISWKINGCSEGRIGVQTRDGWVAFKPDEVKGLTFVVLFGSDANLNIYASSSRSYVEIEPKGPPVLLKPNQERMDYTLWFIARTSNVSHAVKEAKELSLQMTNIPLH